MTEVFVRTGDIKGEKCKGAFALFWVFCTSNEVVSSYDE